MVLDHALGWTLAGTAWGIAGAAGGLAAGGAVLALRHTPATAATATA